MHKATDAHSLYLELTAFPLQKWLHESASLLHWLSYLDIPKRLELSYVL